MSQDRQPPENSGEPDPQHLARIQSQLKRVRPRAADLDAAAIARSAGAADQTVILGERPALDRRHRAYRSAGMMTGVWACGAIAGALATFILMSPMANSVTAVKKATPRTGNAPNVTKHIAGAVQKDDAVGPGNDSARGWDSVWPQSNSLLSDLLNDPTGRAVRSGGDPWPPLRAGDSVLYLTASGSLRTRAEVVAVPEDEMDVCGADGVDRSELPQSTPAPPITREQLLQELLGANVDSIL